MGLDALCANKTKYVATKYKRKYAGFIPKELSKKRNIR